MFLVNDLQVLKETMMWASLYDDLVLCFSFGLLKINQVLEFLHPQV